MDSLPELDRASLYEVPGSEEYVHSERFRFLALVAKLVPGVLTDLAGDPLTEYRAIDNREALTVAALGGLASSVLNAVPRGATIPSHWWDGITSLADTRYPELAPLRDALMSWSQRWHLEADWCIEQACRSIAWWASCASLPDPLRWIAWSIRLHTPPTLDFTFENGGYEPQVYGSFSRWERTVLRPAFDQAVAAYAARVAGIMDARGATPFRRPRADHHLEWLVRFNVAGQTHEVILENHIARLPEDDERRETMTPNTIKAGVDTAANLIGLPLRTRRKPGRLPKPLPGQIRNPN